MSCEQMGTATYPTAKRTIPRPKYSNRTITNWSGCCGAGADVYCSFCASWRSGFNFLIIFNFLWWFCACLTQGPMSQGFNFCSILTEPLSPFCQHWFPPHISSYWSHITATSGLTSPCPWPSLPRPQGQTQLSTPWGCGPIMSRIDAHPSLTRKWPARGLQN